MEKVPTSQTDAGAIDAASRQTAKSLTGPSLLFDLGAELARLQDERPWHRSGRHSRTLVKEPDLRVVLLALRDGARLEEHRAPGPITIQALEGRLQVQADGWPFDLPAGSLLMLEPNLPHAVEAVGESAFLLTIGWPDGREAGR